LKFTHLKLYFIDLTTHLRKRLVVRMCNLMTHDLCSAAHLGNL